MSRRLRVERPPSGVHFAATSQKRIYDPNTQVVKAKVKEFPRNIQVDSSDKYEAEGVPSIPGGAYGGLGVDGSGLVNASRGVAFPPSYPHRVFTIMTPPLYQTGRPYSTTTPNPSPPEPATLCLPLLSVSVHVQVDGTVARTTLVQKFTNKADEPIPKAMYTFPLYEGAVVTSFRYKVDGKTLIGEVRPKKEAREEFNNAVQKKKAAALLEEQTPEIFETLLGNISAGAEVEVHITYVSELRVAMVDQDGTGKDLDVVIPMSIAPRYRPLQSEANDAEFEGPVDFDKNGLVIDIEVNDNGTILDMQSPTHGRAVEIKDNVTARAVVVSTPDQLFGSDSKPAGTQRVASYSSNAVLDGDFVLTISVRPEYMLRSRAVLSPPNDHGHAALMISIKPSDIFEYDYRPDAFNGEVIFVLDRSGSMGESLRTPLVRRGSVTKIGTLRAALPLALSSLPPGCAFNFISFGSDREVMWEESRPYSPGTVKYAKDYIRTVKANMGGTELLLAMQDAVESRSGTRSSTQIIIITDGEVDDLGITDFVLKTRKDCGDRVRFFALGIGDEVSHLLVESIGEFGGGYGEVVNLVAKPQWQDRLGRMLRLGVTHSSWDVDISLGPGFQRRSLLDYRIPEKPGTTQMNAIPYVQAPYPAPYFHPFTFRSVFFLLDIGSRPPPKEVTLTPKNTTSRSARPHPLDIQPAWTDHTTIHHLAVKALLDSLQSEVAQADPEPAVSNLARENAESLGKMYTIASKWTSFVAVDRAADKIMDEISIEKADMLAIDLAAMQVMSEEQGRLLSFPGAGAASVPMRNLSFDFRLCSSHGKRPKVAVASKCDKVKTVVFETELDFESSTSSESSRDTSRERRLSDTSEARKGEVKIVTDVSRNSSREAIQDCVSKERERREQGDRPDVPVMSTQGAPDPHRSELAKETEVGEEPYASEKASTDPAEVAQNPGFDIVTESLFPPNMALREVCSSSSLAAADGSRYPTSTVQDLDNDGLDEYRSMPEAIKSRVSVRLKRAVFVSDSEDEEGSYVIDWADNSEYESGSSDDGEYDDDESIKNRDPTSNAVYWKEAVEAQLEGSSGLFEFPPDLTSSEVDDSIPSARERLYTHFCPGLVPKLKRLLSVFTGDPRTPPGLELSEETKGRIVDTLLMIHYFKIHMPHDRNLWDMVVDKADRAVAESLDPPQATDRAMEKEAGPEEGEEAAAREQEASRTKEGSEADPSESRGDKPKAEALLDTLASIISSSAQHAHYLPNERHPPSDADEAQPGPFPTSALLKVCLACGTAAALSSAPASGGEGSSKLSCPFDGCGSSNRAWASWEELWDHQIADGHVVCREREWMGNLQDEFE